MHFRACDARRHAQRSSNVWRRGERRAVLVVLLAVMLWREWFIYLLLACTRQCAPELDPTRAARACKCGQAKPGDKRKAAAEATPAAKKQAVAQQQQKTLQQQKQAAAATPQGKDAKTPQQQKSPGGGAAAAATPQQAAAAASPGSGKKLLQKPRVFENGFEIHDVKMGQPDGRLARAGKRVSMRYVGRLKKNGKVFDSNTKGKPFTFRLGERRRRRRSCWPAGWHDAAALGRALGPPQERRACRLEASCAGSPSFPPCRAQADARVCPLCASLPARK